MQNTVLQVNYHEVFEKKDFFFVLTQDCFFLVLTMGAAHYTQLPSEQPRSTDFFHKTDYIIINKMPGLKESGPKVTGLPLAWGPESELSVEIYV